MCDDVIRIGGASGYWGDDPTAAAHLLAAGGLDYLVFDYLAEVTLSIMARARAKDPDQGYARDFVDAVMRQNLPEIARQKVRVISNAGGVNPRACAAAVRAMVAEMGLDLTVAVVLGDDLTARAPDFSSCEMFTGAPFPPVDSIFSVNAYLGAFPIAQALEAGADIVITGRCVDSAVTLGACIHAFGWAEDDHDRLAAGTLAGHILECGTQATGGNFTDWHLVAESLDRIGYPICEISADGTMDITKPDKSGGLVSVGTVAEQMLYEIGDPQAYVVPDVICDISAVTLTQVEENRVRLSGARGIAPTPDYKVSATYLDGWRVGSTATFYGSDAAAKAQAFCGAVFSRARMALRRMNLADFTETSVEIIGAGSQTGDAARAGDAREVVVKYAARHPDKRGLDVLLRAASGMGLSAPPGLSGFFGTRARPSPLVRLFSFLLPKEDVPVEIDLGDRRLPCPVAAGQAFDPQALVRPMPPDHPGAPVDPITAPLERLAWGRSGDKGDSANIGIIARSPEALPFIWHSLDEATIRARFAHVLEGDVKRYFLPGCHAMNVVLTRALGGGGVASLRNDALGKGFAQILLQTPVAVPRSLVEARS
ncbi:DUF1446 domain-containing protein [Ruegeria pomeroyi]|uniref:DUF1446 domain-containing protein n=1 Tax=Ruegeria pomeroyi TaxID=89184 RepID=A0A9Q3WPC5_9RHOB|nr:acyclic terpene utilization AtuA family protein [Ruegeria pomeroyi]MCE8539515.1 DUF1446 domain-containing protein [Ruegeria pomeroyi]